MPEHARRRLVDEPAEQVIAEFAPLMYADEAERLAAMDVGGLRVGELPRWARPAIYWANRPAASDPDRRQMHLWMRLDRRAVVMGVIPHGLELRKAVEAAFFEIDSARGTFDDLPAPVRRAIQDAEDATAAYHWRAMGREVALDHLPEWARDFVVDRERRAREAAERRSGGARWSSCCRLEPRYPKSPDSSASPRLRSSWTSPT